MVCIRQVHQNLADGADQVVARLVALGVVHVLQSVDVTGNQGHRTHKGPLPEVLRETTPVQHAGHGVVQASLEGLVQAVAVA